MKYNKVRAMNVLLLSQCWLFSVIALVILLIVRRKLYNPEKSFLLCALNVLLYPCLYWSIGGPFQTGKLTISKAMKYATQKTKLTDFGDKSISSSSSFIDNYHLVMHSKTFQSLQSTLTPIGYCTFRMELNMTMIRRLLHIEYVKRYPFVLTHSSTQVREPVFVVGLPRTGTTFLHRLLSLDPSNPVRAPLTWELLSPIPMISPLTASREEVQHDIDCRRNRIKQLLEVRECLGDNALRHIHEIGFDLPEECLLALSDEVPYLLSLLYPLYLQVDEYFTFPSLYQSMLSAYRKYKETLQILTFQKLQATADNDGTERAQRWILKCPAHLFHTKELHEVFPDAKLIWTHRHPIHAIPSMCSLLKSVHQVYYERDNTNSDRLIGQAVKRCYEDRLATIGDDIVKGFGDDAANVNYEQLIQSPISVVKTIYQQFRWKFTLEYEKALETYLQEDRKKREAIRLKRLAPRFMNAENAFPFTTTATHSSTALMHTYSLQEFGLTARELSSGKFEEYAKRYKLSKSRS